MNERDRRLAVALRAVLPRRSKRPTSSEPGARLAYLERELGEVRARVNALFFAVLTAGLADVVSRLVLS